MARNIIEVPIKRREGYSVDFQRALPDGTTITWGREFKNPTTQEVEAIQVYDANERALFDWEPSMGKMNVNEFKTAQFIAKQSIKAKVGA